MLNIIQVDGDRPRCLFTSFVSSGSDQPSVKRKPYSDICKHPFTHMLDILLSKSALPAFSEILENGTGTLKYAKVHMKLLDVISGDFFNHYIKSGNISMLSSGRPGIDHLFTLHDGVLRLEIDKATFERLGLDGKPIRAPGRKHLKARYLVELKLRLPSMVRGKKGFMRIVHAFESVLTDRVTWLFREPGGVNDGTGPIAEHRPIIREVSPEITALDRVRVPRVEGEWTTDDAEDVGELLEWLGLVMQDAPRVREDDRVDAALSRYQVPERLGHVCEDDGGAGGQNPAAAMMQSPQDLVRVQWRGLITPDFAMTVARVALEVSTTRWTAINAMHFGGEAYMVLAMGKQCLTWEYKD